MNKSLESIFSKGPALQMVSNKLEESASADKPLQIMIFENGYCLALWLDRLFPYPDLSILLESEGADLSEYSCTEPLAADMDFFG